MTMPPPLQYRNTKKRMSTGTKVLIGCGIGCATVILLVIIAFSIGAWWFFSSEEHVPTDRILNNGTSAAFRLKDISENQEMMQLISDVLKEAQRINREQSSEQLPEFFKKFQNYSENQQDPTQFFRWFSPKETTVSMSTDEAGKSVYVIAANFGTGTRMVKMILNTAFENDEKFRGEKISTDDGVLYLFDQSDWNADKSKVSILGFCKGTLIYSNDKEYAISALSQLADESNVGKLNNELSDSFSRLSQKDFLAYGAMDGSFFKNPDHGIGLFSKELRSEIKKAEVSIDNLSSESGILGLHIDWNKEEYALKANEEIEKIKTDWINNAQLNGFDMEILNSLEDKKLDIKFQINDLKNSLIYLMQNVD